jgi:death-on-curing protein
MNYLMRDDLLDLHTLAVEQYGGRLGIRSQDRLLATIYAPQQTLFETELYPDLASKVAIIGFMVLKNRPFNGGNEATALLSMLYMLADNGFTIEPLFPHKLANVLRGVLNSELDHNDLATWLRAELAGHVDVPSSTQ